MLAVGLHPCRPSKRLIDTILPTRPPLLEVIKNIPIDAQRNLLFGAWERRSLRSRFYGLRRCCLKRRFGRIPCGRGSSCSVGRHFMSSRWCPSGNILNPWNRFVVRHAAASAATRTGCSHGGPRLGRRSLNMSKSPRKESVGTQFASSIAISEAVLRQPILSPDETHCLRRNRTRDSGSDPLPPH